MDFARGNVSLDEYIQRVVDEERDVREEIVGIVRLIVEHPCADSVVTQRLAEAIYALLDLAQW